MRGWWRERSNNSVYWVLQNMPYLNSQNMPMLMGVLAAAIILVIAVILFVRYLYKTTDSRKIKRVIKRYSDAYESEVIFRMV